MKQSRRKTPPLRQPAGILPDGGALIGYARVSTEEQSLDMQIAALEKAGCERILSEHISGAAKKRPKLNDAIGMLRRGDVLVVWSIDRIARSMSDLYRRVEQIDAIGAGLRFIAQLIDTTGPMGRLILGILGAVAEFERALIVMRTKAGVQRRRERGLQVGRKPKLTAEQMIEIRKRRKAGASVRELADEFDVSDGTIRAYSVDRER